MSYYDDTYDDGSADVYATTNNDTIHFLGGSSFPKSCLPWIAVAIIAVIVIPAVLSRRRR
jgi:hypothetical protein